MGDGWWVMGGVVVVWMRAGWCGRAGRWVRVVGWGERHLGSEGHDASECVVGVCGVMAPAAASERAGFGRLGNAPLAVCPACAPVLLCCTPLVLHLPPPHALTCARGASERQVLAHPRGLRPSALPCCSLRASRVKDSVKVVGWDLALHRPPRTPCSPPSQLFTQGSCQWSCLTQNG